MIRAHRLSSLKYPNNSGVGASIHGGRWNPKGVEVIYAAGSPSLAALEILVHFSVLPAGYGLTAIDIPDGLVEVLTDSRLPTDWDALVALRATRDLGGRWARSRRSAVLSVPSSVMPVERNFAINPNHPDFPQITFSAARPFSFNLRLK
ncbi:MAG: RES domain-containing protein [Bryobacteraceae bacterium]|nr:RES domain-containing protein [Bryobacteraceae bacterium]